jgi:redox-sensitive bicupin YhaK (pirin superfamily)
MRQILGVYSAPRQHWVGNGFPVRTIFSYQGPGPNPGARTSPFLLLDYAGPAEFAPTAEARGVGEHPHRGFETVTIVYQGEVEHRDSTGNQGRIGPGDVQWMTAASGILHEEMHARDFRAAGGTFEVVQLWVNLPRRFKMAPPGYQTLVSEDIPVVQLADGGGTARVIAGSLQGIRGPAKTFTPVNLWDLRLRGGSTVELTVSEGDTTALFVLKGHVTVNGSRAADAELVSLERRGEQIRIESHTDATVLLMNGEPIDEPVVGYGPFVMNTREEIEQAIHDIRSGTFVR